MAIVGFYNDIFLEHYKWKHPERPERLKSLRTLLQTSGMMNGMAWPPVPRIEAEQVFAVHEEALWRQVERFSLFGGGHFDADTYVNEASFDAACYAAGAATEAAKRVLRGDELAVAFVRPPGHHATPRRAMGFCLFNNVAVAARYAVQELGLERVLILDWDVHHGNGTQDIFYDDPAVFFISTHQYPFYPGTGHWEQRGHLQGAGTTLNVPLPAGCGDTNYLLTFEQLIVPTITTYRPQLILLSAGFDAHWRDPLAHMQLTTQGYYQMAARLRQAASAINAPIAVVLEGGYDLDAIAHGMLATIKGLVGQSLTDNPLGTGSYYREPNIQPLLQRIADSHPLGELVG